MDAANALIFSGDTFGISYRDFDVDGRPFIFPTTTPVHFDPDSLCRSVDRLMSYRPRSLLLGMFEMIAAWLDAHGFPRDDARRHWLLDDDIELNCQGIENWLDRT